jgi:hypothetical protein
MKSLKQIWLWILLLAVVGCSPKPDDTIILLGPEDYFNTMDVLVSGYPGQDTLAKLLTCLNEIPEGAYPPDIEGEYKISEKQFVYSNFHDLDDHHLDMYLKVEHQHNCIASVYFYEGNSVFTDTAYIMGQDPWFTLYFNEQRNMDFQGSTHVHHRLVVITGKKSVEGIENLYFGSLILDRGVNDDPLVGSYLPGWYFVYKDSDGLSENCQWYGNRMGGKVR